MISFEYLSLIFAFTGIVISILGIFGYWEYKKCDYIMLCHIAYPMAVFCVIFYMLSIL